MHSPEPEITVQAGSVNLAQSAANPYAVASGNPRASIGFPNPSRIGAPCWREFSTIPIFLSEGLLN